MIERIQSGEQTRACTSAEALAWTDARRQLTSGESLTPLERVRPTEDEVAEEGGEAESGRAYQARSPAA